MSDFQVPQTLKPTSASSVSFGPPEKPPIKAFKPLPPKAPLPGAAVTTPALVKVTAKETPALTRVEAKPFNGLPLDSCTAKPAVTVATTPVDPDEPLAGQIAVGDPHEPGPRLVKGTRRSKTEAEGKPSPEVDPELQELKGNWPFQDTSTRIREGSIVKLRPEFSLLPLADKGKTYQYGIVVSMRPFVVASRDGECRWESSVSPDDFLVCGYASAKIYDVAATRRFK